MKLPTIVDIDWEQYIAERVFFGWSRLYQPHWHKYTGDQTQPVVTWERTWKYDKKQWYYYGIRKQFSYTPGYEGPYISKRFAMKRYLDMQDDD